MLNKIPATSDAANREATVRVWDMGVRVFHWLLVVSVLGAGLTGFFAPRPWLDLHLVFGTAIGVLLIHRIVWGFTGSAYARFASFVVSPFAALRYGARLVRRKGVPHHIGHNPVGAMMIVALLATLLALTITGVVTLGGVQKDGPLRSVTSFADGRLAKQMHAVIAHGLVALIVLHLLGVIAESARTRENLVAAMFSGRKRTLGAMPASLTARPVIAALLVVLSSGGAGLVIAERSMRPARGVPTAALDEAYVRECGACHTPHHPSVAPAAVWTAILDRLDRHFGDNAELDAPVVERLRAYLAANSAERWDSKAARLLRDVAGGSSPPRITETPAWKRLHAEISEETFRKKPVAGRLNCQACHADAATGAFKPRFIAIPKEIPQ